MTETHPGERIAKVIARAGHASRRDAERLIAEGRVRVNGQAIDSPALNITPRDVVTIDGVALAAPERSRLVRFQPGRMQRGDFDNPPLLGPGAEFLWRLEVGSLVPGRREKPAESETPAAPSP